MTMQIVSKPDDMSQDEAEQLRILTQLEPELDIPGDVRTVRQGKSL